MDRGPLLTFALFTLVATSACSSAPKENEVVFEPTRNQAQAPDGKHEAVYNLPVPTDAKGTVRLESEGVEDIRAKESEQKVPSLHLKMIVNNEKDAQPWMLDARNQQVSLQGGTTLTPTLVNTKGESLPMIEVEPGETQDIDLYYALPEKFKNATEIPGFTARWEVQTENRTVAEATPFDQISPNLGSRSVYPFGGSPFESPPTRRPQSIGVESDWWLDPFTDLPFPWRDTIY